MDWIKKNYDRFALLVFSLLLLVAAVLILLRTMSFGETFAGVQSTPPRVDAIEQLDLSSVKAAEQQLEKPAEWTPKPATEGTKAGSLFVAKKFVIKDGGLEEVNTEGITNPPVPNIWLDKYRLEIISPTVLTDDPDQDGFTTLDEFLGADRSPANLDADSTDPTRKDSHPPFYTKLFLKQKIDVPFRLLFNSYDGDPKKDKPEEMNYQINTLDVRQPSQFLKLGEMVAGTKFKLQGFQYKTTLNPSTSEETDVSELTVLNTETNDTVVLPLARVTNSPDYFALFEYRWPQPPQMIRVKKGQEFVLKPNIQEKYKVVDIKETEALITLPSGEKYTAPRVP